jgi:hypothetical protein
MDMAESTVLTAGFARPITRISECVFFGLGMDYPARAWCFGAMKLNWLRSEQLGNSS